MKKYLFFIAFSILTTSSLFSQDKLIFNDGTQKVGKVTAINKHVVRFRAKNSKKVKRYTDKDIKDGYLSGVYYSFHDLPSLGKSFTGQITKGKVNLYIAHKYVPGGQNNVTNTYEMGGTMSFYYLQKDSVFSIVWNGAVFNKFRNRTSKYFEDCRYLTEKIKSKEFTYADIVKIVKIYNADCDPNFKEEEVKKVKPASKEEILAEKKRKIAERKKIAEEKKRKKAEERKKKIEARQKKIEERKKKMQQKKKDTTSTNGTN